MAEFLWEDTQVSGRDLWLSQHHVTGAGTYGARI
jgi:hypothetical protein